VFPSIGYRLQCEFATHIDEAHWLVRRVLFDTGFKSKAEVGADFPKPTSARYGPSGRSTCNNDARRRWPCTRFEAAVKQKEAAGFTVSAEIDRAAAAAKKFGLDMRPRTVIVFGNPKLGPPATVKTPLLAIAGLNDCFVGYRPPMRWHDEAKRFRG
jgi:hypothetical protein